MKQQCRSNIYFYNFYLQVYTLQRNSTPFLCVNTYKSLKSQLFKRHDIKKDKKKKIKNDGSTCTNHIHLKCTLSINLLHVHVNNCVQVQMYTTFLLFNYNKLLPAMPNEQHNDLPTGLNDNQASAFRYTFP